MSPPAEGASGWRPGSQVGEWILGEKLGAGGMGIVFAARHLATQVQVAIKVLAAEVAPEILARFQREGQAQARVDDHPAILRVHAAGEAWGRPYLVLEFAPGGDLAARLRRGPLPPEQARALLITLAGGVEHLHRAGILHRDLKPENVLFDGDDRPRLTDFGLARFAGAQSLTETGAVLGTPSYMAPEQAQGGALDPRTDVYALGALLFACLTGHPPIEGPSVLVILTRVIEDTPPAPSSLAKGVPADLDALCARAMAKDPSQRYASAAEFAAALAAAKGPANAGLSKLALATLGLSCLLALGLAAGTFALRSPPPPSSTLAASRAPSARESVTPKQVRQALNPKYRRERIGKRRFAPSRLEFVAPGRLLTRRASSSRGDPRRELLELWEVGLDGELSKLWGHEDPRSALIRGGRLFWLEIKPDHSLVLEAYPDFPPLSHPYADCSLSHSQELVYVSPKGRQLAWRETANAHVGKVRLYDLDQSLLEPYHEREGVNAVWLGDSALAATRLGNRYEALAKPTLYVDYVLPTGQVASKTRRLEKHPQAVWGSATAAWVGFADGSLLEVPHPAGERERTYAHAPAGRPGDDTRGSRVRAIRHSKDHLFATTHSSSTPAYSQLVAWPRGHGVSTPIEVIQFPKGSRPSAFSLDPTLGLVVVGVGETPEGLWIVRLHE